MLHGSLFTIAQAIHTSPPTDDSNNDDNTGDNLTLSSLDDNEDHSPADAPPPTPDSESNIDLDGYCSIVEGPRVQASIKLAQRRSKC